MILAIGAIFFLCAAALSGLSKIGQRSTSEDARLDEAWERAITAEASGINRALLAVARPLGKLPSIYEAGHSRQYKSIQKALNASGGQFAGSVEVFLAMQAAVTFISALVLVAALLAGLSGLWLAVAVLFAVAFAGTPYSQISKHSKARAKEITSTLPEFAELLQMPLTSGMGILPALQFTAERLEGSVATEVRHMLAVIRSNPAKERDAFVLAGERLGTAEARSFFNTLMQAHVDGARVVESLDRQAEGLRAASFQQSRAEIKKLPVKLVLVFGLHFLFGLIVLLLVPAMVTFSSM